MSICAQEQIAETIQNNNEADTLYSILHKKAKPTDAANKDEKLHGKRKFAKLFVTKGK